MTPSKQLQALFDKIIGSYPDATSYCQMWCME